MGRIPLITIVGVPNTGKSTLFNRLIGGRKALVHSDPGMTRDIFKKSFDIDGRTCYIQDSGGFFLDEDLINREINRRIFREVKNSDLIIFLFDGKRELLGYEKDLYLDIVKNNTNIIPVVNKVDNPQKFILASSYYPLKLDYLFISAEHNLGIDELLEQILIRIPPSAQNIDDPESPLARISIVGKPNVGKSSIINKILNDECVIVSPLPGTTRDSVDLEIRRNNRSFILVDNAGIRKLHKVKEGTESAAVIRADKDIKNADIVVFVIDISQKIDQNDLYIAGKILKSARPVIVACNKWDLIKNRHDPQPILKKVKERLNSFYFAPFMFTSATSGKNIFNLIHEAEHIYTRLHQKIKPSQLNQILQDILQGRKLLTENNRKFNCKYASIESYSPFFIKFFSKTGVRLKPSEEVYLKKRLQEELDLEGIPVFFKISAKKQK
jgi:GTP-binding protein